MNKRNSIIKVLLNWEGRSAFSISYSQKAAKIKKIIKKNDKANTAPDRLACTRQYL